jgi:hypothetical protein
LPAGLGVDLLGLTASIVLALLLGAAILRRQTR